MKPIYSLIIAFIAVFNVCAQNMPSMKLNKPRKLLGVDAMAAFSNRQSTNEYDSRDLSLQDLSDLLWAANGINRPESGKKTAPSALNSQDIDVYVCKSSGVFLFDAAANELRCVSDKDLRPLMNGQRPNDAPALLLIVADLSRYRNYNPDNAEANQHLYEMSALDAGIVSQNISIFCAAVGLGTRPRAGMNKEAIRKELNLKDSQVLWINHPVGYKKGK